MLHESPAEQALFRGLCAVTELRVVFHCERPKHKQGKPEQKEDAIGRSRQTLAALLASIGCARDRR